MAGKHLGITVLAWATALALPVAVSAAEWQASEQPDLAAELEQAQPLEVERLGKFASAVGQYGVRLVPHRNAQDSDDYDAIVFYARGYRSDERAYIVNLATGETKLQHFPEHEGKTRVEKAFTWMDGLTLEGKQYGAGPDWSKWSQGDGLAWYDPATGEPGGMWEPFAGDREIFWLTPVRDGRDIAIGTFAGEILFYDTQSQKLTDRTITTVPGQPRTGPFVEVAPGRLLGTTEAPGDDGTGVIYGIDLNADEPVVFRKKLPATLQFRWAQGTAQWGYTLGPDGNVYIFLGDVLVRIRPEDAHVEVLGRTSPGRMLFVGDDTYLAGEQDLRRVRGIAQTP